MDVQIHPSWKEVLKHEFSKTYFQQIVTFLKTEKAAQFINLIKESSDTSKYFSHSLILLVKSSYSAASLILSD